MAIRNMGGDVGMQAEAAVTQRLALKMKEGTMSRGMQAAPRSCTKQGTDSPLQPPEEASPADTLIFALWEPFGLCHTEL